MIKKLFQNRDDLTNGSRLNEFIVNPKRALWTLSGPIIFSLLFQALYLIIDTFFVIKVGHEAVAAITFVMPVFLIIVATVTGFGVGVTTLISKHIGANENEKASKVAHHAVIVGLILGAFISLFGYIIIPGILKVLGASGYTLFLAIQYFRIIFIGSFFLVASVIFRSILAGEGNHVAPATILVIGTVINLILDPIFIIVLDWGIRGAAWATFCGFLFSFVAYFIFLFIKNSSFFDFNFKQFNFNTDLIKKIFKIGAPIAVSQMLLSSGAMFVNYFVSRFGQEMVAGFGLASRLEALYTIVLSGISTGLLTLLAMYLGAKRYDLIKFILYYSIKVSIIISLFTAILLYFFSGMFLSIFTNNIILISVGILYFKITVYSYPLIAIMAVIAKLLQVAGHPIKDILINLYRLIIFFIPLVLLLAYKFNLGIKGIWYARLLATFLALVVALFFYKKVSREIKESCKNC
jgi:MATE family, multidrug efflux pump